MPAELATLGPTRDARPNLPRGATGAARSTKISPSLLFGTRPGHALRASILYSASP
jgi:hypothetical protein